MTTEIIEQPSPTPADSPLIRMSVEQIDLETTKMEKFAEAMRRFHIAACRATLPHDWIDFGGKPYLEGEGAMRIAAAVGLRLSEPAWEQDQGEWFEDELFFECAVEVAWPLTGASFVAIGDCNTADKFFAEGRNSKLNQALEQTGHKQRLARKLISLDVKKKAHSNAISNAVRGVLGLKGLTWDDLKQLGLDRSGAGAGVDFKKGASAKKANGASTPAKTVKIGELLKLPKESVVSVGGELAEPVSISGIAPKAWHVYVLKDDTGTATIKQWVADAVGVPDEALPGNYIHFAEVKVDEYQGKPQYKGRGLQLPNDAP